nr:MAG TPA: virulence protein RhuM family [Caudoviricetes sp.]
MVEEKNVVLYGEVGDGPQVSVLIKDETMWLTQKQMAELFSVDRTVIGKHLKNIFESGELTQDIVCAKNAHVASDGRTYESMIYSLDAIIAVGYRVNSSQATRFRIWATSVLKEYIIKGFALDDERLKLAKTVTGKDYFRELLERVRSIRASEQRIWLQVTEIFAACSIDYDKNSPEARRFFATVQNLFHYAITGQTAAEIIHSHADRNKPNMGLTTWRGSPDGRIYKYDIRIAKNYLEEGEIKALERAVNSFFDYIERQIELRKEITMNDMASLVIRFLTFNDYKILEGSGKVSAKQALRKAYTEYEEFNKNQEIGTDFKKFVSEVKKLESK